MAIKVVAPMTAKDSVETASKEMPARNSAEMTAKDVSEMITKDVLAMVVANTTIDFTAMNCLYLLVLILLFLPLCTLSQTVSLVPATSFEKNTNLLYGSSIAMTSNWLVVGAYRNAETSSANKAFIYKKKVDGTWGTKAAFSLDQNTADANFGYKIAMTPNWIVVSSAFGAKKVFIFKKNNTNNTWETKAAYTLYPAIHSHSCLFGIDLAMTDNWIAVGTGQCNGDGTLQTNIKVFRRNITDDTWETGIRYGQETVSAFKLTGFGYNSLAMTENWIVTSGSFLQIFKRNDVDRDHWKAWETTTTRLYLSGGTASYSSAMTNNWIVLGSNNKKRVYIYKKNITDDTWGTTSVYYHPSGTTYHYIYPTFTLDQNTGNEDFGLTVAMTENFILVGTQLSRSHSEHSKAFIFKKNNSDNTWNATAALSLTVNDNSNYFIKSIAITDTNGPVIGSAMYQKVLANFYRKCDIGSINKVWHEPCFSCLQGTYSDETGYRTSCKICASGKSNFGTANIDCTTCPRGRTMQSKSPLICNICASGQYQPEIHLDLNIKCITCPTGRYIDDNKKDDKKHASRDTCLYCPRGYQFTTQTTSCKICQAGFYQNEDVLATSQCVACPAGRYIDDDENDNTKHESENNCKYCPKGWEFTSQTTPCNICTSGRYQNEETSVELQCKFCPAGKFNGDARKTVELHFSNASCADCVIGTSSEKGSAKCTQDSNLVPTPTSTSISRINDTSLIISWVLPSPSGSEKTADTMEIQLSTDRLFPNIPSLMTVKGISGTSQSAIVSNLQIPPWKQVYYARVQSISSNKKPGAWSITTQKYVVAGDCEAVTYLDDTVSNKPFDWRCETCPPGGYCDGSVRYMGILPKFGWAVCKNSSTLFQRCTFPAACNGKPNLNLLKKYKEKGTEDPANCKSNCTIGCNIAYRKNSQLCGACASNYSHGDLSGQCNKCPEDGENTAFAFLGLIVGMLGVILYVKLTLNDEGKVDASDAILAITLSFIQLISLLTTFPIEWPSIFIAIFQVGGAITVLGQHLVNLKCMLLDATEADVFYVFLVVWALIPFLLVGASHLIWKFIPRFNQCSKITNIEQKRRTSIVALLNLIWPSLVAQTFKSFSCISVCDNGLFLRADINEPCFKDRHLYFVIFIGIPMMLGYVLGFPIVALLATHKLHQRAKLKKTLPSNSKGFQTWGSFFSAYRTEVWWWEGTVSSRKFVLAAIGVFGSDMGQMQVLLTLMLVMIVIVITATVQPFSDLSKQQQTLQNLEIASLLSIFLTLWSASVFKTYPKCEDPQFGEGKTIAWCDFLSVMVGLTNFGILFMLVSYFLSVKVFGKTPYSVVNAVMNGHSPQELKKEVGEVKEDESTPGIEMSSLAWQPKNPCYQINEII